jgi:hypothetical protein
MVSIKEIVKDNVVDFVSVAKGTALYKVNVQGVDYIFSVDLNDIGEGTLLAQDKAIFFMRYIRKAIESNDFKTLE